MNLIKSSAVSEPLVTAANTIPLDRNKRITIKLRDLQYLVAIDDHKHFGRAANACLVSQPTLSGQIMKLEELLKLQLIERHTRKISLTAAGEVLIQRARNVINAAEMFESYAKSLIDPLVGDLHVGLIPTLAPYFLPHIMPVLQKELPNINFYFHEEKAKTLSSKLEEGKLDFLIAPYSEKMKNFDHYNLFEEELILAFSDTHTLAHQSSYRKEDISNESVITMEEEHCLREHALGYCCGAGAHENTRFKASSLETLRLMVASNMGITLLPKLATLSKYSEQGVQYASITPTPPKRNISLLITQDYSRMKVIRHVVSIARKVGRSLEISNNVANVID